MSVEAAGPERRTRVLFVASHPVQYQAPLFRRLASDPRIESHVVYATLKGAQRALDPEFGTEIKWDVPLLDGYEWQEAKNFGSGKESFGGLFNPSVWNLIRSGKFDAVVSFVGYVRATFWIALLAAKFSGAAFLFGTDATSLAPRDGRKWKIAIKKIGWPFLFRLADQVIALSTAGVEFMCSLGIPRERVSLIPFVVDNDWWKDEAAKVDRDAVRKSWDIPANASVVLFCAKLQPWKRPQDLLRAFARAAVRNTFLVFAGDGTLRSEVEREAATLGVKEQVRFLGFVNQRGLPAVYTAGDLFVLPSGYDPCPVVVCEAMLCGCPVVISDEIRGRFDLVRPGVTGGIFPCGDVEALAELLRKILGDSAQCRQMSENARLQMATWSPSEYVTGVVNAVESAVTARSSSVAANRMAAGGTR